MTGIKKFADISIFRTFLFVILIFNDYKEIYITNKFNY